MWVADRRRPGRPRVTNPRTDRFITLTHIRRRFQTTSFSNGDKFCKVVRYQQTDSVAPPEANYSAKGPMWDSAYSTSSSCPFAVGTTALPLGRQQWAQVLFSDESRFNLSHHDGRIRVFRRRGKRFVDKCLIERDRFGGGSVMVWGAIMGRRKTNLIVVQGYINQILQCSVKLFLSLKGMSLQY